LAGCGPLKRDSKYYQTKLCNANWPELQIVVHVKQSLPIWATNRGYNCWRCHCLALVWSDSITGRVARPLCAKGLY